MRKQLTFFLLFIMIALFVIYIAAIFYGVYKKLPRHTNEQGQLIHVSDNDIRFVMNLTYVKNHQSVHENEIQKDILQSIKRAKQRIVLDCFLFNTYKNKNVESKPVVEAVVHQLIAKKQANPKIAITLITDPINSGYGSYTPSIYNRMKKAGIEIRTTRLDAYRDSTPLVSALWRLVFKHIPATTNGKLPNLLADSAPKMSLRSYLGLANIKANHRKVLIVDDTVTVMSGNIHNASTRFGNIAFTVKNAQLAQDAFMSEQAVVTDSKKKLKGEMVTSTSKQGIQGANIVQLLTEKRIKEHILKDISQSHTNDTIWMGMFYIADRQMIHALLEASKRGVTIKLILDPNIQSFGHKKLKLPNAPVAAELQKKSHGHIHIKWYHTRKEQYHTKLIYFDKKNQSIYYNGSANLTTRNLDNANLETDLKLITPKNTIIDQQVLAYFHRLWNNEGGRYTDSYEKQTTHWEPLLRGIYRWQTILKLTTY